VSAEAIFAATRQFNWQPQEHYGPEGSDDYSEWDAHDMTTAKLFQSLAGREISWVPATTEWMDENRLLGEADFGAAVDSKFLLIVQGIFLGFPDPPEFTIVLLDPASKQVAHLGHFDVWPANWRRKEH